MAVLEAPDGSRYETEDEAEIRNLTLGHGYKPLDEPAPAAEPGAETGYYEQGSDT